MSNSWIRPDWPAPPGIHAMVTTRLGPGISRDPYGRFNLGLRSGEAADIVAANRAALGSALGLPSAPHWLRQVHGRDVVPVTAQDADGEPQADGAVTSLRGTVLAILTADCLPVLFCTDDGQSIAAAHAGWRGLAAGVLEAAIAALAASPARILAWLGPCVGAPSYEVGAEVRAAFLAHDPAAADCFTPTRPGHWRCGLAALARQRLAAAGVTRVHGGGFDTLTDPRCYSYRREGAQSGRFASLIWRT